MAVSLNQPSSPFASSSRSPRSAGRQLRFAPLQQHDHPSSSTSRSCDSSPSSPSDRDHDTPEISSEEGGGGDVSSWSTDSDSEDRMFFGTPQSDEVDLIARLSKASPGPGAVCTPQREIRTRRLGKRDSREFMRRKTMLHVPLDESRLGQGSDAVDKVWPGGFYERRSTPSPRYDSDEDSAGPSSPTLLRHVVDTPHHLPSSIDAGPEASDLTLDFSRWKLSDTPTVQHHPTKPRTSRLTLSPTKPGVANLPASNSHSSLSGKSEEEASSAYEDDEYTTESEGDGAGEEGEDSDKENAPVPVEGEEEGVEVVYDMFEGPLMGVMDVDEREDGNDILRQLDMGGLRIDDLADPDTGFDALAQEQTFELSDVESQTHSRSASPSADENEEEEVVEAEGEAGVPQLEEVDCLAEPDGHGPTETASPTGGRDDYLCVDAPTDLSQIAAPAEDIPEQLEETVAEDHVAVAVVSPSMMAGYATSDGVVDDGSPLPVNRAGPVIIPSIPFYFDSPTANPDYSSPAAQSPGDPSLRDPSHGMLFDPYTASEDSPSFPSRLTPCSSTESSTPISRQAHHAPAEEVHAKKALKSTFATALVPLPTPLTHPETRPQTTLPPAPAAPLVLPPRRELSAAEAAARSAAVKSQLAGVFGGKKPTLGMGAPSRSVSAASSSSSGSSRYGSEHSTRPGVKVVSSQTGSCRSVSAAQGRSQVAQPGSTARAAIPNRPPSALGSTATAARRAVSHTAALSDIMGKSVNAASAKPIGASMSGAGKAGTRPPSSASAGFARRPPTVPITVNRPVLAPRSAPASQPSQSCGSAFSRSGKPPSGTQNKVIKPISNVAFGSKPRSVSAHQVTHAVLTQMAPISTNTLAVRSPVSAATAPASAPNPLKRPLPQAAPAANRIGITSTTGSAALGPAPVRPALGLPSRVVGDQVFTLSSSRAPPPPSPTPVSAPAPMFAPSSFSAHAPVPVFSLGVDWPMTARSPGRLGVAVRGTPMSARAQRVRKNLGPSLGDAWLMEQFGTPSKSRLIGTPSRPRQTPSRPTPMPMPIPVFQTLSTQPQPHPPGGAAQNVSAVETAANAGPPASNTRQASEDDAGSGSAGRRGSSEDHEEVSFALPATGGSSEAGSSPVKMAKQGSSPAKGKVASKAKATKAGGKQKEEERGRKTGHGRDRYPGKMAVEDEEDEEEVEAEVEEGKASSASASASASKIPVSSTGRPKRQTKPPAPPPILTRPTASSSAATTVSIAPGMSDKELRAKTAYNTSKNEKYLCAIEKKVVRVDKPRPPSPTSSIPTVEAREEEEKRRERERRAKGRGRGRGSKGSSEEPEEEDEDEEEGFVRVKRLEGDEVVWRGDEGWSSSDEGGMEGEEGDSDVEARPTKRARTGTGEGGHDATSPKAAHGSGKGKVPTGKRMSAGKGKGTGRGRGRGKLVKWDKGLVVIRDDGTPLSLPTSSGSGPGGGEGEAVTVGKSALSKEKQIELDQHGNVLPSRPRETLKPARVVVSIMVYEGEVSPGGVTRSKKKAAGGK